MADRAPAPRHGGAGRFSWAIRRAVAEARRDGFVSAVVVHDWQLRVTAKLHMHERAKKNSKVAAPTGRSDQGEWRRRATAPPPAAQTRQRDDSVARGERRDEEQREQRGPNSRQRRSMARLQAHKEQRAAATAAAAVAPRLPSEFDFAAADPRFTFAAAEPAGAGTVVVASATASPPATRFTGCKRDLEEVVEWAEDEEYMRMRRGAVAGAAGGVPPALM